MKQALNEEEVQRLMAAFRATLDDFEYEHGRVLDEQLAAMFLNMGAAVAVGARGTVGFGREVFVTLAGEAYDGMREERIDDEQMS
jgi:hypothetical protein